MKKLIVVLAVALIMPQFAVAYGQERQAAMEAALESLKKASLSGDTEAQAAALCEVANLNLASSLDAEAEEYASRAEVLAREKDYKYFLAKALIIKADLCSFAETDSTFNRNDEGLGYAKEALELAEACGYDSLVMKACCSASQLYVNKNRWNKVLDNEFYSLAGEYLDRAEKIAENMSSSDKARLLAFRMRYYRQGGLTDKAIEYCEDIFSRCSEDDYILKMQICDQLTPLYITVGRLQEAANAHSACIHYQTLYSRQREAADLQELQTKYKTEKKRYQILLLASISTSLFLLTAILIYLIFKEKRRRRNVEEESRAKSELIEFMSRDLRNPLNASTGELERFAANAGKMNEQQIIAESKKLLEDKRNLSREVAEYVSEVLISRKKTIDDFGLSQREMEIIRLSVEGLSAAQIADKLFISVRTVSNHKVNIYSKMGVRTNGEMCRIARETGLI